MDVTTRMEMQPHCPSLAAQLLLCFPVGCHFVARGKFLLRERVRVPPCTHDTSRSAFGRISQVQDSNCCACFNGSPATTKNFATCPASGLVLSTCAILDLVWSSVALPTSESRTSRDPVVTRQQAAERARRLLQHVVEGQSIICRGEQSSGSRRTKQPP